MGLRIRPRVPINPNMTVAEIYRCAFFTAGLVLLSGSNCWGQTISAASNGAPHIETKSNVAPRISENALFQKVNDSPSVDVASSAPPQREARTRTPHVKFDVIGAPHVDFDVIEAPHVETKSNGAPGIAENVKAPRVIDSPSIDAASFATSQREATAGAPRVEFCLLYTSPSPRD